MEDLRYPIGKYQPQPYSSRQLEEWIIDIKDNGVGFNAKAKNDVQDNYGLKNMRERAIAGKFKYTLQSNIGLGAKTLIIISIKNMPTWSIA